MKIIDIYKEIEDMLYVKKEKYDVLKVPSVMWADRRKSVLQVQNRALELLLESGD